MNKEFIPYTEALALKELGFDEPCFSVYYNEEDHEHEQALALKELGFDEPCFSVYYNGEYHEHGIQNQFLHEKNECSAPLYQQVINWFAGNHQIYIGKTGYDDGITPKRFVYHVNDFYVQEQSYDGAIKEAIEIIKNK